MLDTVREVHTPEGVALRLPAAGPVPRALAWAIDLAIRLTLLSVCSAIFGALGEGGCSPGAAMRVSGWGCAPQPMTAWQT